MGKRKTLRQKQRTDIRRQDVSHQETSLSSPFLHSYSYSSAVKQTTPQVHTTVVTDVRKTALISVIIVAAQVMLFLLLQNHVLALPFVRY